MKIFKITSAIFFLGLALTASADSSSVQNNISINASTGGNSGNVSEGITNSNIKIKTIIDGKVIQDIDRNFATSSEINVTNKVENGNVSSQVKVNSNSMKETKVIIPIQSKNNSLIATSSKINGNFKNNPQDQLLSKEAQVQVSTSTQFNSRRGSVVVGFFKNIINFINKHVLAYF
jgi:hypothetical protein